VASLSLNIGEFFTMGLTAIPAVVLGHMARRQMRETGERGDGMAVAGLFLGWAGIGLFIALIAGLIVAASAMQSGSAIPSGPPGG
jgi:NhaP-type Na+/H+ or K+/H+ antiporter